MSDYNYYSVGDNYQRVLRCPQCDTTHVRVTKEIGDRGGTIGLEVRCDSCNIYFRLP